MPTIQHRCNAAFATWAARCARLLLGTALLSAIPLSAIAGPPPAQCFFTSDHVHEGTAFRIYRSDNCGPPALTKHPLIVFSHGDGFGYKTYDAFMKALVGTSAIVVSVVDSSTTGAVVVVVGRTGAGADTSLADTTIRWAAEYFG